MKLSRLAIRNFRNFENLDVRLDGDIVIVGENRVGKTNLIFALRLVLDPSLPDSQRHLSMADYWDGLSEIGSEDKITVEVEVTDFSEDLDLLALLTDFRINDDHESVRLTYEFRPKADLESAPCTDEDFEFITYGGDSDANRFGFDLRQRFPVEALPALRDAESDLQNWRRSPLKPLIEEAFVEVPIEGLDEVVDTIRQATESIVEFESIQTLQEKIAQQFLAMSGPKQDVNPSLGITPLDTSRLNRNIRLLIDDGLRGINEASLGSANLLFLALKLLFLQHQIEVKARDHTLLAIEEPEAHLHPHLQRSVYSSVFNDIQAEPASPVSIVLTTHSPHIASVAPLTSLVLLKSRDEGGTTGHSIASLSLTSDERDDLARYLDVTRAEILFSRGVVLVEGDAERFLLPVFADTLGLSFDKLGITVCSVSGVNFAPYIKLLSGLDIPFVLLTDWDPKNKSQALGINRTKRILKTIEKTRTGRDNTQNTQDLNKLVGDDDAFRKKAARHRIFLNSYTLEVDLFESGFNEVIIPVLREFGNTGKRKAAIDEWEEDPGKLNPHHYLAIINDVGKGRFAQRLASRAKGIEPPPYIANAMKRISKLV